MKTLHILIILLLFCLVSCIIEDSTDVTFTINNQSEQAVKISIKNASLDGGSVRKDTVLSILVHASFTYNYSDIGGANTLPFGGVDTVWVIFNTADSVLYVYKDNSSRNILKTESYEKNVTTKKHITSYTYTYTLTEEDYQNAIK